MTFLAAFRWYRRWKGGHWECWFGNWLGPDYWPPATAYIRHMRYAGFVGYAEEDYRPQPPRHSQGGPYR